MNTLHRTLFALSVTAFSISGCTTQKPAMGYEDYQKIAAINVLGQKCAFAGKINAQVAAVGSQISSYMASGYSFSPEYLQGSANAISQKLDAEGGVTDQLCNQYAYFVAKTQLQINANAAAAAAQQQQLNQTLQSLRQSAPTTTYCNQYGMMVQCQTY